MWTFAFKRTVTFLGLAFSYRCHRSFLTEFDVRLCLFAFFFFFFFFLKSLAFCLLSFVFCFVLFCFVLYSKPFFQIYNNSTCTMNE